MAVPPGGSRPAQPGTGQKEQEMGYEPEVTHYRLQFSSPQYEGLEVVVSELSVGDLLELAELADAAKNGQGTQAAAQVGRMFEMLGGSLVEWNLTRNGEAVPANADGVRRQTLKLNLVIVEAWIKAMAEVDLPLPDGSSDGETSLEPSIPMEPLSPSPGS